MKNLVKIFIKEKGFTLIELIIVVAILAAVVGIGLVSFRTVQQTSRSSRITGDLKNIQGALETYYSDWGAYPGSTTFGNMRLDKCAGSVLAVAPGGRFECNGRTYMAALPTSPLAGFYYRYYACVTNTTNPTVVLEGQSYAIITKIEKGGFSNISSLTSHGCHTSLSQALFDGGNNYWVTSPR